MHEHRYDDTDAGGHRSFWKTPLGWAFLGFAAVAAFFLLTEHTVHVFGVLPWLLILACPLMHMFMHGGHGHGGQRRDRDEPADSGSRDSAPRRE